MNAPFLLLLHVLGPSLLFTWLCSTGFAFTLAAYSLNTPPTAARLAHAQGRSDVQSQVGLPVPPMLEEYVLTQQRFRIDSVGGTHGFFFFNNPAAGVLVTKFAKV